MSIKKKKKKENLGRNVHSRFIRKNSNLKDVGHLPTGGHVYAKKYYSAVKRTMHPTTWGESHRLCIECKKLSSKRKIILFYSLCMTF